LHVKENQVWRKRANELDRFFAIPGFAYYFDVVTPAQQLLNDTARERFIVDNQDTNQA